MPEKDPNILPFNRPNADLRRVNLQGETPEVAANIANFFRALYGDDAIVFDPTLPPDALSEQTLDGDS